MQAVFCDPKTLDSSPKSTAATRPCRSSSSAAASTTGTWNFLAGCSVGMVMPRYKIVTFCAGTIGSPWRRCKLKTISTILSRGLWRWQRWQVAAYCCSHDQQQQRHRHTFLLLLRAICIPTPLTPPPPPPPPHTPRRCHRCVIRGDGRRAGALSPSAVTLSCHPQPCSRTRRGITRFCFFLDSDCLFFYDAYVLCLS